MKHISTGRSLRWPAALSLIVVAVVMALIVSQLSPVGAADASPDRSDPVTVAADPNLIPEERRSEVVTDLTAQVHPDQIRLTWSVPPRGGEISGYSIYRNSNYLTRVTTTEFTDTNVTPDTTYNYEIVTKFVVNGETDNGHKSPRFTIATSSDPDQVLTEQTQPPRTESAQEAEPIRATSSKDTTADSGSSPVVAADSNQIPDEQRHEVVTDLTAQVHPEQIRLTWSIPPRGGEISGYSIYRNSNYLTRVTTTEFTDTNVTPDTTYNYEIVTKFVVNGETDNGHKSPALTATTLSALDPISNLRVLVMNTRQATLAWDAGSGSEAPDGYLIKRNGQNISDVRGSATSWVDLNFNARVPLTYTIRSYAGPKDSRIYGSENSVVYQPGDGTTAQDGAPPAVSNLSHVPGQGAVKLRWKVPARGGVVGFSVERYGLPAGQIEATEANDEGWVEWQDEQSQNKPGVHVYTVRARNLKDNVVQWGPPASIEVTVAATGESVETGLGPVGELTATQTDFQSEIEVDWEPGVGPTPSGYNVSRNGAFVASVNTPHYFDTKVEVGKTYSYTVTPYLNGDETQFGARMSSAKVTVESIPTSLVPDPPTDLAAKQMSIDGTDVKVSWKAPAGFAYGLIAGYHLYRNGTEVGYLTEPDFGSELPHPDRSLLDKSAPIGMPLTYSVVAYSNEAGKLVKGSRSASVVITTEPYHAFDPGSDIDKDPADVPTEDVPSEYVRAMEVAVGAEGVEAQRLGATFFVIDKLRQDPALGRGVNYRNLLIEFNSSLAGGQGQQFQLDMGSLTETADHEIAATFYHSIARWTSSRDLLAIFPEYRPDGYGYLLEQQSWNARTTTSFEDRTDEILEALTELETLLDTPDTSPSYFRRVRDLSQLIVHASLNIASCKGNCTNERARFFDAVMNGVNPTAWAPNPNYQRHDGSDEYITVPAETVASRLFNAASKQDRAAFYDMNLGLLEFAQPFQTISAQSDQNVQRLKTAEIRKYIGIVVGIVLSIATMNAGLGPKAYAAVTAFNSYLTTFILTGSGSKSEKAAARSLLTSALTTDVDQTTSWTTLVKNALINTLLDEITLDNPGEPGERFLTYFVASNVSQLGQTHWKEIGELAWKDVEDVFDVLTKMVLYAVFNGVTDWDEIRAEFETELYGALGASLGILTGKHLPKNWKALGPIFGDLAIQAAVLDNSDKLREYFDEQTVPRLAEATGGALGATIGKDNLFELIVPDLTRIALLGLSGKYNENGDNGAAAEKLFEQMVYSVAGRYVGTKVKDELVQANGGKPSALIDALSNAVQISIAYGYDSSQRQAELQSLAERQLASLLIGLLPAKCQGDRRTAESIAGNLINTLANSDNSEDFKQAAVSLVTDGLELGQAVADLCRPTGDDTKPDCTSPTSARSVDVVTTGSFGGRSASGSVVKLLQANDSAGQPGATQCTAANPDQFRIWLLTLNQFEIAGTSFNESNTGWERILSADEASGFFGYSVRYYQADEVGFIYGPGGTQVGIVGLDLDSNGKVTRFLDAIPVISWDSWLAHLDGETAEMLRDIVAIATSAASGCGKALTDFTTSIKELFLEIWNAESLGQYLAQKWADVTLLWKAFEADPEAFTKAILVGLLRLEELESDPVAWAGAIVCDIVIAVISARVGLKGGAAFAKLFTQSGRDRLRGITKDNDNSQSGVKTPCNSFPSGTRIRMGDGSLRPIELVEAGEFVLAGDPLTGRFSNERVLSQWSHPDDGVIATVTLADGSEVSATDHHEFWVASDGAWLELDQVQTGDFLLTPDGVIKVAEVTLAAPADTLVWELDTGGPNTFTVHTGSADVLVHNARCRENDALSPGILAGAVPEQRRIAELWAAQRVATLDDLDSMEGLPDYVSEAVDDAVSVLTVKATPDQIARDLKDHGRVQIDRDADVKLAKAINVLGQSNGNWDSLAQLRELYDLLTDPSFLVRLSPDGNEYTANYGRGHLVNAAYKPGSKTFALAVENYSGEVSFQPNPLAPRGGVMFDNAFDAFAAKGKKIDVVEASWTYGDNLSKLNEVLRRQADARYNRPNYEEAIAATFTGKMTNKRGLTKFGYDLDEWVEVEPYNGFPQYDKAYPRFTRPD